MPSVPELFGHFTAVTAEYKVCCFILVRWWCNLFMLRYCTVTVAAIAIIIKTRTSKEFGNNARRRWQSFLLFWGFMPPKGRKQPKLGDTLWFYAPICSGNFWLLCDKYGGRNAQIFRSLGVYAPKRVQRLELGGHIVCRKWYYGPTCSGNFVRCAINMVAVTHKFPLLGEILALLWRDAAPFRRTFWAPLLLMWTSIFV